MNDDGAALAFSIRGIGLVGPGLADWRQAGALLREGGAQWQHQPTQVPAPLRLPATERRRAGIAVKASLVVADEACATAGVEPAALATVFASSTGDPANCHAICEALAAPERLVSPTRFTNSVHNAPAGYWHIATRSMQASTSLAAFDASFGAALLEAAAQAATSAAPVLLVVCDAPYPEPLHAVRPIADAMAVALVVAPPAAGIARLQLRAVRDTAATPCEDSALEGLRVSIPAARALPLLQALAQGRSARVVVEGAPGLCFEIDIRQP